MRFLSFLREMRPLSYFILTRGLLLTGALLVSALVMLVWAGSVSGPTYLLRDWADYTVDMAAVVLGAGLIGSLLLEEAQGHT